MPLTVYRRRLPHWRSEGGTYFVTWCVHRSRPPLAEVERRAVLEVLLHFDRQRFDLHAAVVMDDHVHVVVTPYAPRPLQRIVQGWKAVSAKLLRDQGRSTPFWQIEYYDRLIRSPGDLREKIRYLINNPPRRWPMVVSYPYLWVNRGYKRG